MIYRNLGTTDVKVSAITFGAWAIGGWMWGGNEEKESLQALDSAIDNGITSIDTAPVYGFGHSEKLVGQAIKGKRDKVQVMTKCGLRWDQKKGNFYFDSLDNEGNPITVYKYCGKESIIEECEFSLKRLQTDYIDLLQIHWPDASVPIEDTMEAFEILQEQGKIRAYGVSNYSLGQTQKAYDAVKIASNQVPFSMVNKDYEQQVIPYCIKNNISILAYSPLQRGLLTGKITSGYQFKEGDHRSTSGYFKESNLVKVNGFLDNIKHLAEEHNCTLAQLVLNWTIAQPGITVALAGARNQKQATENAEACALSLSKEEITFINSELKNISLDL